MTADDQVDVVDEQLAADEAIRARYTGLLNAAEDHQREANELELEVKSAFADGRDDIAGEVLDRAAQLRRLAKFKEDAANQLTPMVAAATARAQHRAAAKAVEELEAAQPQLQATVTNVYAEMGRQLEPEDWGKLLHEAIAVMAPNVGEAKERGRRVFDRYRVVLAEAQRALDTNRAQLREAHDKFELATRSVAEAEHQAAAAPIVCEAELYQRYEVTPVQLAGDPAEHNPAPRRGYAGVIGLTRQLFSSR